MKQSIGILFAFALVLGCVFPASSQTCTQPLHGGSLSTSKSVVCPLSLFLIEVSGATMGSGLSYQWEASVDSVTWKPIPNFNYEAISISQNVTTWYRRKTTCNAGSSVYSDTLKVPVKTYSDCYCEIGINYCTNGMNITKVVFGSINNSSSCSANGYANYTTSVQATDLMQGTLMPIMVSTGTTTANYVHCYADFNQNGAFEESEQTLLSTPSNGTYSGFIKVPFKAVLGKVRLRLILDNNPRSTGCYPHFLSETEDYAINIVPHARQAKNFVWHVRQDISGTGRNGQTWANALPDLRTALSLADAGDTIKVAKGTYYNGTSETNGLALKDSITVLGGYPAAGNPTDAQRNPAANPTVLVGTKNSTNAEADYHVVLASGQMNFSVLDGFILQGGGRYNGNGASQQRGGGISIEDGANILVRNCVFSNNFENQDGSAIAVYDAKPVFENCIVTGNTSVRSSILIQHNSDVRFVNLLAARNRSEHLLKIDASTTTFRNSTLAGNTVRESMANVVDNSDVRFFNSILYFNVGYNSSRGSMSYDSTEIVQQASSVKLQYCLTQVHQGGQNLLLGQPPKFRDTANVAGADGLYFTADDGFVLLNPCSPAINAGMNDEAAGILVDITGSDRIVESRIDLGAYEVQQNKKEIPTVLYVNAAARGSNDGSSWANAFTDLHKALESCSDTIKIAGGTYFPWKTPSAQPYWIENKRVILGAYPATGNPADSERNYTLHQTKIDGTMEDGQGAEIVVRGQNLDSTSQIDGLVITNTGRTTNADTHGAVVYTYCNNPSLSNMVFTGNTARAFLGRKNKALQIGNCRFEDNNSDRYGQLDLIWMEDCGQTSFRHCSISRNALVIDPHIIPSYGRVIILANTDAVVDSCVFDGNASTVFTLYSSNAVFRNSRFLNNYSGKDPTSLAMFNSDPTFTNCLFRDSINFARGGFGGFMNNYRSNPSFTDCQFSNSKANYGGVAFNDSSAARFVRCVFTNNSNPFFNQNGSNIVLENCLSSLGTATSGPLIGHLKNTGSFMHNIRSSPVITNCVVVNNFSGESGVIYNDATSAPKISNSIFWKNFTEQWTDSAALKGRLDIVGEKGSAPVVENSMFEFYEHEVPGNNTARVDPRFKNFENPIGPDNLWFTDDDGLQLCDCSQGVNTGKNSLATGALDLSGKPRIFQQTVDRGAYELQNAVMAPNLSAYYVWANATGNNSGADWNNAYTNLHTALSNPCADTIYLGAGTYTPSLKNRDSLFSMNRNLVIKGSYNPMTGKRDVDEHPSILSGDIGIVGDSTDNSFGILAGKYIESLIIDGLVLQDANSENAPSSRYMNAFKANYVQNLSLMNCRFNRNVSRSAGGAIHFSAITDLTIDKTVFTKNKSGTGGALYFTINGGSSKITNCVFDQNIATHGGGLYNLYQSRIALINCLFLQNYAKQGAGIFFEGRTAATITNCTFFDNRLVGGTYFGADIYCRGTSWQYGGGPYISNSIFTGEPGNTDPVPLRDIYSTESVNGYKVDLHLQHSATVTEPQYNFGGAIIHPRSIIYRNVANPIGPDGRWFTSDDGLQQVPCSAGIDVGANNRVNAATDISQGTRIFNTKVDMGAYESVGQADWSGLLNTASDSLIANKEVTDTLGWTHYFNGCRYLLSIKKDGKAIGTVGDGSFELKVFTSANYGTGKGMNLTDAAYNTSGMPWYVMNRYWNVKSNYVIKDSILVRFPYTNADFNDVKGSNPSVTEQNELVFFKVSGTNNPFDLSVPASRFFRYTNAALPSLSTWKHLQQDTIRLSEYYVNGFSGGGGGAYYNGDLPDLIISNVSLPVTSIGTGESITASFTVSNNSTTGIAGGNNVMLFLSKDKQLTPGLNGDSLLATVSVQSLGVSASTGVLEKQVFIPCTLAPGNYYLFFLSDGNNNVAEANEHNNSSAAIPLTVTTGLSMPAISAITASPAATVCSGTNVTLTVNSANCASCNYTWSNGSDGNTTTVTTTSNLTVTATNVCGSATVSQQVVVKPLPTIAVWPGKSEICLNDSVTLNANGAESFTWNGVGLRSVTGAVISAIPTTPGVNEYIVTGITNGCSSSTKVSVAVLPAPVLSIAPLDTTVCQGQSLTLTASGAVGYDWSPASGLNTRTGSVVIASPASTTTYVLTGTSANGCKSTISRTITPKVLVVPAVSIAYTGCPENKLSFTANSTNGGSNPQYQWYMNGQYQGSGQTITLNGMANGAAVFVKMTSDAACAYPLTVSSDTVKVACITTSVPVVSGLEELSVSPNPGNGLLQVKFKLTTLKTVSFIVTNSEGKRVHQTTPVKIFGSSTQKIDLRGQPQGLYFVQIAINDKTIVERVVIAQ